MEQAVVSGHSNRAGFGLLEQPAIAVAAVQERLDDTAEDMAVAS